MLLIRIPLDGFCPDFFFILMLGLGVGRSASDAGTTRELILFCVTTEPAVLPLSLEAGSAL